MSNYFIEGIVLNREIEEDFSRIDEKQLNEIKKEYNRIDGNWLTLHYRISVGLVFFAFFIECVISMIVIRSDLLKISVSLYFIKYLFVPSLLNCICVIIGTILLKQNRLEQKYKMITVSIMFSFICFILVTAHSVFVITFFIFSVAIMLTLVYANQFITLLTSLISIILLSVSELYIKWNLEKESIFESTTRLSNFLIAIFTLITVNIVCMIIIQYEQKKNLASIQIELERRILEKKIKIDELTGIYNRKAFYDMLKDIDDNKDGTYILAIIDIDKFKEINDTYGHHRGDTCLVHFAKLLKEYGIGAIPYRYGGDEFCFLFFNKCIEEVKIICDQIRLKTKELIVNEEVRFTASFGLAEYEVESGAAQLFVRADQALYKAKIVRDSIEVHEG